MPGAFYSEVNPATCTADSNPWAVSTYVYTAEDVARDRQVEILKARIAALEAQLGPP